MKVLSLKTRVIAIVSFIIALILFYLASLQSSTILNKSFKEQIDNHYETIYKRLSTFQNERYQLLTTLANHPATQSFLQNLDTQSIKFLFNDFAQANGLIMQIRILSLQGEELIRLDQNRHHTHFKPQQDLQNKAHRYYFQQFNKLHEDELGLSYLDLNIENKKIERPFKATVRLGMPIYVHNQKRAILIVNYAMNDFLKQIFSSSFFDIYLTDKEYYFITHMNPKYAWSKFKSHQSTIYTYFNKKEQANLVFKPLNFWGNNYYIIYNPKQNTSILTFINLSKNIGVLILLASSLLILPFMYILFVYVTQTKRINAHLTNANNKMEAVLDHTSDIIILIDEKGFIKEVNKAVEKTFGYTKHELLNKNVNILVPQPHHDKHDEYIRKHDKQMHSKVINQHRELYGQHKDGSLISIHLTVTKVTINHQLYFIGTVQNVTESLKNKKLFENVFNSSSVGLALILKDGSFWRVNQRLCSILEYSQNELMKLQLEDITLKEDKSIDDTKKEQIINNELNDYTIQKRLTSKFGKIIFVKLTVTGVFVDFNKEQFDYFIVVVDDITEQLSTQNRLQEAEAIAQMGHWHWDIVKNDFKWSQNMLAIFGKKEAQTADYNDFILSVENKDKQRVNKAFNDALVHHKDLDITFSIIVNENIKVIHAKGSISFKNKQALEFFGTCQDITELQH